MNQSDQQKRETLRQELQKRLSDAKKPSSTARDVDPSNATPASKPAGW